MAPTCDIVVRCHDGVHGPTASVLIMLPMKRLSVGASHSRFWSVSSRPVDRELHHGIARVCQAFKTVLPQNQRIRLTRRLQRGLELVDGAQGLSDQVGLQKGYGA